MLKATLIAAAGLAMSFAANAAEYPALKTYEAQARSLEAATRTARATDRVALTEGTRELLQSGIEVMRVYAAKMPACQAQYEVIYAEAPTVETKTLEELHARYHNGVGLPVAPKYCYLGRSQYVHPAMNLVRLQGEWNEQVRSDVLDDLEEVIEHVAKIQRNLDNPPQ